MRIVINRPIDISEFKKCKGYNEMMTDFKSCCVQVRDYKIIPQKIDLDEEAMDDNFLYYLEEMGVPVILEMYNLGRYTLLQKVDD